MEPTIDHAAHSPRSHAKLGRNPFEKKPGKPTSPERESVQQMLKMLDQIGSKPGKRSQPWHQPRQEQGPRQAEFRFQRVLVDLPAQIFVLALKGVMLLRSVGPKRS